jgi:hypothetical protein
MRRVYGNPEVFSLNTFSSRGIQYPELPLPELEFLNNLWELGTE